MNENKTLSILIPARNEMFLVRTIEDLLQNIEGDTEILVGLDGQWSEPGIPANHRVKILYFPDSIGQRAITNYLARLSNAKYLMKVDAHCSFDKGFDVKMMEVMQDDWTMAPLMRNLHAFDWVCQNGHRRYQGPSGPCQECNLETKRDILWLPKPNVRNCSYRFDKDLHFQYFNEYKRKQKGDLVESMSLQGSCFMMTRQKYWELNICDEGHGSWGQQGTEVACKTWLSGGKVIINKKTWYAHLFRTQGGDFGFPYPQSGRQVEHAREYSKKLFLENNWDKAIHPLQWLVDKFAPVPGWHNMNKGIIFYTDNRLNTKIAHKVQKQLLSIGLPIVSASLKPMPHFGHNIHLPLERGYVTMFKQILAALEASNEEIVFFCEHDVIYHPSHFDFNPPKKDVFYYNLNVWKVRAEDGHALWVNNCRQVSGICVYRETAIKHYKERVALAESGPWQRGFGNEPGTLGKTMFPTQFLQETWMSEFPNLDIRHNKNLTLNRWSQDLFRHKEACEGWTEKKVNEIKGWENFKI